jgi:hypothetical protein
MSRQFINDADGKFKVPLKDDDKIVAYLLWGNHVQVGETSGQAAEAEIKAAERGAKFLPLNDTPIATDLVYGLINVRTDGTRVLCGYKGGRQGFRHPSAPRRCRAVKTCRKGRKPESPQVTIIFLF